MKFDIVVCDNQTLIDFLSFSGYTNDKTVYAVNPRVKDIKGMKVYGAIPLWLAVHAKSISEAQFDYAALSLRGKRLYAKKETERATVDDLAACFKAMHSYKVEEVEASCEPVGGIRLKRT